ncbi:type III toxin-antitoxin system ToxN/AbiQ family toxin [Megasphaera sp. ASD88]|uniref:type III toxin-antitoxin system ToxN/AbiQ family toxin n=1 Tax=Megasphaera sp. ASD88 TaxID=2027407 RepID=UPI003514FA48
MAQEYMTYLQRYELKVPNIGYAGHTKFVCGIVLKIHDANYFAPISSNTKKFRTSFAIKNSMGTILSTVRLSFMFSAIVFCRN